MPKGTATETLVPAIQYIRVGDAQLACWDEADGTAPEPVTYRVATFSFVKTVRAFELFSELAAAVGTGDAVEAATDQTAQAPTTTSGFITKLVELLPSALRDGVAPAYALIGLIGLSNQRIKQLDHGDVPDVDVASEAYRIGKEIAYNGSLEEVMNLVHAGIQALGVETVVKSILIPLVKMVRSVK